jgi:hypothetical protein
MIRITEKINLIINVAYKIYNFPFSIIIIFKKRIFQDDKDDPFTKIFIVKVIFLGIL